MSAVAIRILPAAEIDRIGAIDRTEHVTRAYTVERGLLVPSEVDWHVKAWSPTGDDDQSVPGLIAAWRPLLESGGVLLGACDGVALVGFAIYRPRLTDDMGQLAALYVTRARRHTGIGSALTEAVATLAIEAGAARLYVSSIPSVPTVEFYRRHGFDPTREPHPELFALEPDDVHMVRSLTAQ